MQQETFKEFIGTTLFFGIQFAMLVKWFFWG